MFPLTYFRYVFASTSALGLDTAIFLSGLALGTAPMFAAAAGYTSGLLLHWLVSSRKVFSNKLAGPGSSRRQQQALFFASALVGLATTVGIIRMGELAHLNPLLPKLVAIGVSFQITYILRKTFVFA